MKIKNYQLLFAPPLLCKDLAPNETRLNETFEVTHYRVYQPITRKQFRRNYNAMIKIHNLSRRLKAASLSLNRTG